MRYFAQVLCLLVSVFSGYAGSDASPSLSELKSADVAPPAQSIAPAPAPVPASAAEVPASTSAVLSGSTGAGTEANGAESLQSIEAANKAAESTQPETPAGTVSLKAEEQADAPTPAEEQAQQQQKEAIDKVKAAQAQKEQADKDKAAAEAELNAAKTPEEKEEAEAKIKRVEKEEKDAKKAQEDAERSKKDADKAFAAASKNGAKLRAAKLEAKKVHSAEVEAQSKADKADVALAKAKEGGNQQEIAEAEKNSKQAHKDLLKAQSATAKIDKNVSKLKDAGETATSKAALAKKALSDADKAHEDAQNAVFADQEALAKAQAGGKPEEIAEAQARLAQDQADEKRTAETLTKARADSQKANEALNAELMKTETPEETRDRLAAEANSNLSAAQISQRSAQDALTIAQTQLNQAQENGAPAVVQQTLKKNAEEVETRLKQANENLIAATQSVNAANADADSPLGIAQNNIKQLQSQQQDLQSQKDDAASAVAAAGLVITSSPDGSPKQQAAREAKAEAEAQVAELQKKIEANNQALEKAKAELSVAHQNETNYQQALAERRLAKKNQQKAAKEEAAAQKNFDALNKLGTPPEQLAAAQDRLKKAVAKNVLAMEELKKCEEAFNKAEELAQTPLQRLRLKISKNQAKMAELQLNKAKIYQDLTVKKAELAQQVARDNSKTSELRAEVSRLEFTYDDVDQKIDVLQKSINEDQAKIAAVDQAVKADALGEEDGGLIAIEKRFKGDKKTVERELSRGTTNTGVQIPEGEAQEKDGDEEGNSLNGPDDFSEDDTFLGANTDEEEDSRIPTFQRGSAQPIFAPGVGPAANFTSPGGGTPNFNKAAGAAAAFSGGVGAIPAFNASSDVSFGNAAAPLPWSGSATKAPSFGTTQSTPFGGSGAPTPIFGGGSQTAFGGPSSTTGGTSALLPIPTDGLTKIKTATHLDELAPPSVSEEKKQALRRAKESLARATARLKAAEKTENLGTITNAQVSRDVAELKYEQALNNASPLGVPETEAQGWWNKDPISPYSKYNVDGGGRMNAPLETSERTEHFVLNGLESVQPVYTETLPDGAKVLAVENVGFAMKQGKAIPAIVKLAQVAAAA